MQALLMGPPGAGKGTQAQIICREYGVPQIATGDMLRRAGQEGTELGREAQAYMERGDLVPDAVVIGLIRERLGLADAGAGFVLDGFPRTIPQAQDLDGLLAGLGKPLEHAILLEVPEEAIVTRISGRLCCETCGCSYHLPDQPPPAEGRCSCGGVVSARPDDLPEAVRRRLRVYAERTAPLAAYYEQSGILRRVDGLGSVPEVTARIRSALED